MRTTIPIRTVSSYLASFLEGCRARLFFSRLSEEGLLPVAVVIRVESAMASGCRIGPSILNSDLAALGAECGRMMDCGADYLHLDVMDG